MTTHMSQKQRIEFNEQFLKMEKELREKKFKREESAQVAAVDAAPSDWKRGGALVYRFLFIVV